MRSHTVLHHRPSTRSSSLGAVAGVVVAAVGGLTFAVALPSAHAIGTSVDLGTAGAYSVLGGQSVTNTGPSVLPLSLGVSPGSAASGFPPGRVGGETHRADAVSLQAQSDLRIAYDDAAGQASDASIGAELGNLSLAPGVYTAASATEITGTLTLDAQGDPNAVFVFQIGSALDTNSNSTVSLVNGARGCNVFWQVGSTATLDTNTTFVGTIMALTSVVVRTGSTIDGRALARNGSVTLDDNVFTDASCAPPTPGPTTGPTTGPTGGPTTGPTGGPTTGPTSGPTGGPTPGPTTGPTGPTDGPTSISPTDGSTTPGDGSSTSPGGGSSTPPGGGVPPGDSSNGPPGSTTGLPSTGSPFDGLLIIGAVVAVVAGICLTVAGARRGRSTPST